MKGIKEKKRHILSLKINELSIDLAITEGILCYPY